MEKTLNQRQGKQLTIRQALIWILISIVLVTGSVVLSWTYFKVIKNWRSKDASFTIITLVQTGPQKEALKTAYLAEVLGLSVDKPINLYAFDVNLARRRLLSNPLIKEATVKVFPPGVVYLDYALRQPVAYLGDYTNSAIDVDGVIFPYEPFITPKRLPEIYLGLPVTNSNAVWGRKVQTEQFDLALLLIQELAEKIPGMRLLKLDLSRAFDESYGRREVIVLLEDMMSLQKDGKVVSLVMPRILRLNPGHIQDSLENYIVLRDALRKDVAEKTIPETKVLPLMTIDLRMPSLAFVKEAS